MGDIISGIVAGILFVVWIIFTIVYFVILSRSDGIDIGGIILWIALSFGIFVGGSLLAVIVLSDPILMCVAVMIIAAAVVIIVDQVRQSDTYKNRNKNRKRMEGVKKREGVQQASSEELLKRLSRVEKGQVIPFGIYDWTVLEVKGDRALLFVEQIVGIKKFDRSPNAWQYCSLRKYLNGAFLRGSFSANERALILETTVKNLNNCEPPPASKYMRRKQPKAIADTVDRIFLLSWEEVEQYVPEEKRKLQVNDEYIHWWVRNTNTGHLSYQACCKGLGGKEGISSPTMDYGVRPAMWVKIK